MSASLRGLFQPLQVGRMACPNRVFMAPLTRSRATMPGQLPNATMAEMYGQRATGGLLIAEATSVVGNNIAFRAEPGCFSDAQVAGWKLTTDAVHAKGGRIFVQLFHAGRAAHPDNNAGNAPVAPSAIKISTNVPGHFTASGKELPSAVPRALADDEIPTIVAQFRHAARRAMAAGFDGVEVHGANGYLLSSFLSEAANVRTSGPYAGNTVETRAKLLLDTTEAVAGAIGADRVGVRLSPLNRYNDSGMLDPVGTVKYLGAKFTEQRLSYLHVMRRDFYGPTDVDVMTPARTAFKGVLIGNMGYTAEEANAAIESHQLDAVAFGMPFLTNPDLPERFQAGAPLNGPNMATLYGNTAVGYTDYPKMATK